MAKVKITADSTCDLSPELIERYNIDVLPLYVNMGDKSYRDGVDLKTADIYEHVKNGGDLPKTSAPAPADFIEFFKKWTEQGYEIVHFGIGSALSVTYQVATLVAAEFDSVYVVDTKSLSTGFGQMAILASKMADEGKSAKEIYEWFTANIEKFTVIFVIDTLEFLYKGGRCSLLSALGANLLKIKPSIVVTKDGGKMTVGKKYRGKIVRCYEEMVEDELRGKEDLVNTDYIFITHSDNCEPGAVEAVANKINSIVKFDNIYETNAGCVIGTHSGPGCLGIIYSLK